MSVDKDKPHTWVKYKDNLCQQCIGTCCTMPAEIKIEDLFRLGVISEDDFFITRRKLAQRLKKQGLIQSYRESTELFMLTASPSGECYYLDRKTRLCTVYDKRPNMCRNFPLTAGNRLGCCPMIKKG